MFWSRAFFRRVFSFSVSVFFLSLFLCSVLVCLFACFCSSSIYLCIPASPSSLFVVAVSSRITGADRSSRRVERGNAISVFSPSLSRTRRDLERETHLR